MLLSSAVVLASHDSLAFAKQQQPLLDCTLLSQGPVMLMQTFCRKFCWHSLMLWPEDMPQTTTVSLSANDDLVPKDLVVAQLKASPLPARVMVHPTAGHGGYLLDQQYQESLITEVQRMATIP